MGSARFAFVMSDAVPNTDNIIQYAIIGANIVGTGTGEPDTISFSPGKDSTFVYQIDSLLIRENYAVGVGVRDGDMNPVGHGRETFTILNPNDTVEVDVEVDCDLSILRLKIKPGAIPPEGVRVDYDVQGQDYYKMLNYKDSVSFVSGAYDNDTLSFPPRGIYAISGAGVKYLITVYVKNALGEVILSGASITYGRKKVDTNFSINLVSPDGNYGSVVATFTLIYPTSIHGIIE